MSESKDKDKNKDKKDSNGSFSDMFGTAVNTIFKGSGGSIVSSLVNGAVSLLGQSNSKGISQAEMNFNAQEAQKNRDFQREMWHLNNEYNSIGSQINRALEAGVNPNAILSGNTSSAVSSAPSGAQASYSSNLASSMLSTLPDTLLTLANVKKTESETDLNIKNREKLAADIAKIYSDIGVNDFNKDLQERTFAIFESKTQSEIKVMAESLNKLRNESLEILKNIELKDSEIAKNEAQTDLIESQKSGQDTENAIMEVKKKFSDITGIPLDAPESAVIFTLWQQGKFQELSDKFLLNDANMSSSGNVGEARKSASRITLGIKEHNRKKESEDLGLKEHKRFLDENPELKTLYNPNGNNWYERPFRTYR